MLQEGEIANQSESAYHAYLNEKPSIAIWALEKYIDSLNRVKEERTHVEKDKQFFFLSPDDSLTEAHGRLGILFNQIGNNEKSKDHLNRALSINNSYTEKLNIQTEDDLISFLTTMDERYKESKKRIMNRKL